MVYNFYNEVSDLLRAICLQPVTAEDVKPLPALDLHQLSDDQSNQEDQWSFLVDRRNNKYLVHPDEDLYTRMLTKPDILKTFKHKDHLYRRKQVGDYLDQVELFRRRIAVLIQLTWGQPARAPELLSIKWKNSSDDDQRGVFIEDGMVALVTRVHKLQWATGEPMVIHRYLPDEVGKLLVYYLWLVVPFEQQLCVDALKQEQPVCPFLWPPNPNAAGAALAAAAVTQPGGALPAVAPIISNVGGTLSRTRAIWWNGERLRNAMEECFRFHAGISILPSMYRHIAIAIYRKFCLPRADPALRAVVISMGPEDIQRPGHENEPVPNFAHDLQAGHTTRTAQHTYARTMDQHAFSTEQTRTNYRKVSKIWHQQLFFDLATEAQLSAAAEAGAPARGPGDPAPPEERSRNAQLSRRARLQKADLPAALRQILTKDNASFQGCQQEALEKIADGVLDLVVVMATGQGKSLLFMLPAKIAPGGLTVVVVPLVALRRDLVGRCSRAGLSACELDANRPTPTTSILFVTPEASINSKFNDYLTRQRALHRLDRIFFDECHVLLSVTDTFRSQMRSTPNIKHHGVPVICLTATLAVRDEPRFQRLMWEHGNNQLRVICHSTVRQNVSYLVKHLGAAPSAVIELIRQKSSQYAGAGTILVYAGSLHQGTALASRLTCPFYDVQTGGTDEGKLHLKSLVAGTLPILVATSALGLGIDAPLIRAVIHVGPLHHLQEYAQESGRAGRDGRPAEAIILRTDTDTRPTDQALALMLVNDACRRTQLDMVMDGNHLRRWCHADKGEALCDWCAAHETARVAQEQVSLAPALVLSPSKRPRTGASGASGSGPRSAPVGITATPPIQPAHRHSPSSANSRASDTFSVTSSSPETQPSSPAVSHGRPKSYSSLARTPRAAATAIGPWTIPPPPTPGTFFSPGASRSGATTIPCPRSESTHSGSPPTSMSSLARAMTPYATARGGNPRRPPSRLSSPIQLTAQDYQRDERLRRDALLGNLPQQSVDTFHWLLKWQSRCLVCALAQHSPHHQLSCCAEPLSQMVQQAYQLTRGFVFADYSCHFACGLPQSICFNGKPCALPKQPWLIWKAFLALYYCATSRAEDDTTAAEFYEQLQPVFEDCSFPHPPQQHEFEFQNAATELGRKYTRNHGSIEFKCTYVWKYLNAARLAVDGSLEEKVDVQENGKSIKKP